MFISGIMDPVINFFIGFLYMLISFILQVIDTIVLLFRILCGLAPVEIQGGGTVEDILLEFLQKEAVMRAFWTVLLIAFIVFIALIIFLLIRSYATGDSPKEKKRILSAGGKSLATFVLVPVLLFIGIFSVNAIVRSVDIATGGSSQFSIGGQIVSVALESAGDNDAMWKQDYKGDSGESTYNRDKFLASVKAGNYTKDDIEAAVNFQHFNIWLPLIAGAVCLVSFGMTAFVFIRRLYDIIILFVVSPLAVATTPADDGARFKNWRDSIVSKVISGYGVLIAMNVFLMVSPFILQLNFFDPTNFAGSVANSIAQILFLAGGALAVSGANVLIANILGGNAAAQEAQSNAQMFRQVAAGGMLAKGLVGGAARGTSHAFKGAGNGAFNFARGAVNSSRGMAAGPGKAAFAGSLLSKGANAGWQAKMAKAGRAAEKAGGTNLAKPVAPVGGGVGGMLSGQQFKK